MYGSSHWPRGAAAVVVFLLGATSAPGQERGLVTRNPLDEIKDELVQVLERAGLPFSEAQARSIALVLEESRRASEQLFGDVMNFSAGPPQGEQLDRARAGIAWMNEDFSQRVRQYLDPAQLKVWDAHLAGRGNDASAGAGTAGTSRQVQQIRINNNPFTPENQYFGQSSSGGSFGSSSGSGVQAQIIQRGGTGAWHGTYQFRFKDESLNARNPFASNRPPYQQRNINLNTSGPLIRNRLTLSGGFNQSEQDNAETVNAQTLQGRVRLGFTRPYVFRSGYANGTLQLNTSQSLHFNVNVAHFDTENQGVGGFSLPERAINYDGGNRNTSLRHVWFVSDRTVEDITFSSSSSRQTAVPATSAVAINVLGAFNGGGASNDSSSRNGTEQLSTLWIHTRDRWTLRTGGVVYRPRTHEISRDNFLGAFTFSDLPSYGAGTPILYTVTRGNPELKSGQSEWSLFVQHELRLSNRFTVFSGLRYERQTNLNDGNNLAPRASVAYALGSSTVVRAGLGIFHSRVGIGIENTLARLDGARQFEIVVTNPSYPDPFQSGDAIIVPPSSRRVRAQDLAAPYDVNSSVQIERSFRGNLFVTASYDYQRGFRLLRSRNLNAPPPGQTVRPSPSEGNVWRLESTGRSTARAIGLTMRQRLSIFTVNADYTRELERNDTTGAFGAPTDNHDLRADFTSVTRQRFSMGVNARLPWGVFLTTNVWVRDGNPYSITTGRDDNGDGVTNDRPPGVPRDSERGPRTGDVSANVSKAFQLGRRSGAPNLNVFANLSNAFNWTHFGTPVGIRTSPHFGRSISAFDPREIEVGVRFQF
ncbi:MAG: hypothetical protein HY701_04295 [Gemmatimonadetes bacterium]|nr:hypothetical protein [Gemmatimonadota bacterium]